MPVGILLLYFLLLRMQSFSHHGAICVEVPHFANLHLLTSNYTLQPPLPPLNLKLHLNLDLRPLNLNLHPLNPKIHPLNLHLHPLTSNQTPSTSTPLTQTTHLNFHLIHLHPLTSNYTPLTFTSTSLTSNCNPSTFSTSTP